MIRPASIVLRLKLRQKWAIVTYLAELNLT